MLFSHWVARFTKFIVARFFQPLPIAVASTSLLAFFSMPLGAQEAGGVRPVEEITVTARKREESLQDIPAMVSVFTEKDIERSNITRAGDIALLTPGVSLVDAAEAGDTQVNIRGMNGARDAENSYALVIDGITMSNPASLNREYSNLQQIEVLKGPQGAIYGRNGSAGAFIITTKVPEDEMLGQLKVSGGQDTTYSVVGDIAGPITDSMRGSLMGEYFTTDGYYNNEYLGRDDIVDNRENWAVTGRLIFDISDKTELDAKLRYGEVDASSITFNSVFNIGDLGGFDPSFYENVNDHQFRFYNNIVHTNDQEATEFSLKLEHELDGATLTAWGLYSDIDNQLGADGTSAAFAFFAGDGSCQATVDTLGAGGIGYDLNDPQFIGLNAYPQPLDANGSLLGAYTPLACDGTQYQKRDQEDISFELRLASDSDGPLQWMGGLYYLTIDREVAVSTGIDRINASQGYANGTVIQQPYVPNNFSSDPAIDPNPTDQLTWDQFDTDVYSIFGQIGYSFTDSFTADLALRYDREERKVKSKVPTPADGANPQYIDPCIPFGTPTNLTPINPGLCGNAPDEPIAPQQKTFEEFQPKLSFTWDALESTTIFGSWGVGFRSGGFNNSGSEATIDTFINGLIPSIEDNCGAVDNVNCFSRVGIKDDYDEETSSAVELGFKSNLAENAVRLEAAVYYNKVDDMQFFEFVVGPFGLLRVVENIDEVELKGVEAGVTWDATDWLDLFVGGNYTKSKIKKNSVRPDTVGNDSPYTPDYTANLGAYFTWPVGDNMSFFTNLDVAAIGKTWFHVVQDQERPIGFELLIPGIVGGDYSAARRDSYALANLRLGLEGEKWTAALWSTNVTDEDFLEEVIPAPEFGGSFIHPGTERRVGADFSWRF